MPTYLCAMTQRLENDLEVFFQHGYVLLSNFPNRIEINPKVIVNQDIT